MKLTFYLRYNTKFGQRLFISGSLAGLGNDDAAKAQPMEWLNEETWYCVLEVKRKELLKKVRYRYFLLEEDGNQIKEWNEDRLIDHSPEGLHDFQMVDTWNNPGEYENIFYGSAFKNVFFKTKASKKATKKEEFYTHIFRVKAPLLKSNEAICLLGTGIPLGDWASENFIPLSKEGDWWTLRLDLSKSGFPVAYKYGVFDAKEQKFLRYEDGSNRMLYTDASKKKLNILHDGFVHLPNNTFKAAGVNIPVFSLRSKNSFGTGEFSDIKLLVDWARASGLKLIQLLPVNDTILLKNWRDSYPYRAISAFALHPIYIDIFKVAGKKYADRISRYKKDQKELNAEDELQYEKVLNLKLEILKGLYELMGRECFESADYIRFFDQNRDWLEPYAGFSFLRDKYGGNRFEEWRSEAVYQKAEVEVLFNHTQESLDGPRFYCFVQYHLHLQLREAADYARKKGIILKGDIPIGIARDGCDSWVAPELYDNNWQAGAPPDDFSSVGQNWKFPIYIWDKMKEDGYSWWKRRFDHLSNYFDAIRFDHILGFFRIWAVPNHAIQGILGRFIPCIPVHINEFGENGIWFEYRRYCKPFINDEILHEIFGDLAALVQSEYVVPNDAGGYEIEFKYETQKQIEEHFDAQEHSEENFRLRIGLYELVANVILIEEESAPGEQFHFRIGMESTHSFRHLIPHVQDKLRALYNDYFFHRQDKMWKAQGLQRLPALKASTEMMVCGEDLGMVPSTVPEVMQEFGIISLEVQRMPKQAGKEFLNPDDAPYLSVITPSTHDMSTIRGFWEENRDRTQHFYNDILGQWGDAPQFCEAWINRAVIIQHLYSPAMWSIFLLQDLLGMSENLRREDPQKERINVPADENNYWKYRMHLTLEDLIKEKEFSKEIRDYVEHSGR